MGRKSDGQKKMESISRDDRGEGRKGHGWLKDWLERQGASGLESLDEQARGELRSLDPLLLTQWSSRLFWESREPDRWRILNWIGVFLTEQAGPFFMEVLESDRAGLEEKKLAMDRLEQSGSEIDPGHGVSLDAALRFVEKVFPGLIQNGGEKNVVWEEGWEDFRIIAESLQGTVARELLNRYPGEALSFVKFLLGMRAGLLEEVLESIANNPHQEAARLLEEEYIRTDSKTLRKRIKKLNHKRHSRGLPECEFEKASSGRVVWSPPVPPRPLGVLSISDSPGSRMVWVIRNKVPKGMLVFCGLIYDERGLVNFFLTDATQGEAEKYRASLFASEEALVAETDAGYCAYLIEEAYKKAPPQSQEENSVFKTFRHQLKELIPAGTPQPPIYGLFSNADDTEDGFPSVGETGSLADHKLLRFWHMEPGWLRPYLERYEEILGSRIIIQPLQKKERIEAFYREVAGEILADPGRRALWLRRVEDAAWVLLKTGSQREAELLARIGWCLKDPQQNGSKIAFFTDMVRKMLEEGFKEKASEERERPSLIVKPPR